MITKVTKDNKGLYRALFEKATTRLYGDDPTEEQIISSIDDYFCAFKTLTDLDDVFAVLPLDEPFFEIDANTRVITVPSEFKKNGISVKGDQIAEIVYFTIDRYYDTTDLFDDDIRIYIQWEAPNGDKGLYPAIFKDITILKDQGKMLFGWTIDNKITQNSGTMKFSVRFLRTMLNSESNKQEIVFSLSTLTANAIVNPGLDFEFVDGISSVEEINNLAIVRNRMKDSEQHDSAYHASTPEFLLDIPASADIIDSIIESGIEHKLVDLNNGTYKFIAQATSDDAGVITYEWYRAPLESGTAGNAIVNTAIDYVETTDTHFSGDYAYYTHTTVSGEDVFTPYVGYEVGAEIPTGDEAPTLYIAVSTITAAHTGNYWVIAKNRNGKATATKFSTRVQIPGPGDLSVATNTGLETDTNGNFKVLLDDGEVTLTATGSTTRLGNDEGIGDKITYTWSEGDLEVPDTHTSDNGVAYTLDITVDQEDRALYDETFKLTTIASRNGDSTPVDVKTFRVTDAAHVPNVAAHEREAVIRGANGTVTVQVDTDIEGMVSDELTYQWYRMTDDAEDDDFRIEGANEATLTVDAADTYYCLVTNHVNGSTATTARPDPEVEADRRKYTIVTKRT